MSRFAAGLGTDAVASFSVCHGCLMMDGCYSTGYLCTHRIYLTFDLAIVVVVITSTSAAPSHLCQQRLSPSSRSLPLPLSCFVGICHYSPREGPICLLHPMLLRLTFDHMKVAAQVDQCHLAVVSAA